MDFHRQQSVSYKKSEIITSLINPNKAYMDTEEQRSKSNMIFTYQDLKSNGTYAHERINSSYIDNNNSETNRLD